MGKIAVVCFLLTGCDKQENIEQITDDKVSVDKMELTFTQKDESKTFSLFCQGEWHLEADGLSAYSARIWLTSKTSLLSLFLEKGTSKLP